LGVPNSQYRSFGLEKRKVALVGSCAALTDFHRALLFKIESADCLAIFRLDTGHSQALISRQRSSAGD
jgi:hypothetical protein